MMNRRKNPPATMSTSANSHQNHDLLFSKGIPSQSASSKKAGDVGSLDQLAFDSYDHSKKGIPNHKIEPANDLLDPKNDRIDEEDDYWEYPESD
jgi:hypothetical protein